MKLNTLQNIIEFQDVVYDGVFKNISEGCQYLLGPGLPDICIVYKRFKKAININLFNRTQTTIQDKQSTSSFHFVQGLCPQSTAEVSAYFSQIMGSQEKDTQYKLFTNGEFEIHKISYLMWDFFSNTMLVSQHEIPSSFNQLSQFKTYGIQASKEQRIVNVSEKEIEGAYVSSVIRSIDQLCHLPLAGKFFRNVKLANSRQIKEFLKRYFKCAMSLQNKLDLSGQLHSIDSTLYQLNWSLSILIKYLERIQLLEVLYDYLLNLKDNLMQQLVCAILSFKLKKYTQCQQQLALINVQNPTLLFPKFLQAKVFIKQRDLVKGFCILEYLLPFCTSNVHVWAEMVRLMRIKNNYQVCLLLLNRATQCPKENNPLSIHSSLYITNYRVLCGNKNLSHISQLESIFETINPLVLDQVEAFHQLIQYPIQENLQIRQRNTDKAVNAKKQDLWFKQQVKSGFKISQDQYDTLINNKVFDTPPPILKELKKIQAILGSQKVQNLVNDIFLKPKIEPRAQQNQVDLKFEREFTVHDEPGDTSVIDNLNKSMNIPKLMDDIRYSDEDEQIPSFLKRDNEYDDKQKRIMQSPTHPQNQRFPKRSQTVKNSQNSKQFLKAFKGHQSVKGRKTITIRSTIQENVNESQESERLRPLTPKVYSLPHDSYAPSSGIINKKYINSLGALLSGASIQSDLRNRNDPISPIFQELIKQYIQLVHTVDSIFSPNNAKINYHLQPVQKNIMATRSAGQSPDRVQVPLFKSNLPKTLLNKQHIAEQHVEIKEFYILPQNTSIDFVVIQKQETIFLYKCAQLAYKLKRREISKQICAKLNIKGISVQLSNLLIKISSQKSDPRSLIKLYKNNSYFSLQRSLNDFQDCGVQTVSCIPLWMEEHIIRVVRLFGANCLLGMLVNAESDFTFYLIKQVILSVENLK